MNLKNGYAQNIHQGKREQAADSQFREKQCLRSTNNLQTGYARIRDLQANSPEATLLTDNCKA